LDPVIFFYTHTGFMTAGFLLMSTGAATAVFMKRRRWWLSLHKWAGALTVVCFLCGFASAIVMIAVSAGTHFTVAHARLGLLTTALSVLTLLLGHLQFRVRNASGKIRDLHRWSGRITLIFACMAIASGLWTAGIF
jgi:cytochrome c biogenesis protein CcdA